MSPLRDQILKFDDVRSETLEVPEWGGAKVVVRGMSAVDRESYESGFDSARKAGTLRAKLVTLCAYDEEGSRIFEPGDVEALGAKDANAVDRVYQAALKLSVIGEKAMEQAEKN